MAEGLLARKVALIHPRIAVVLHDLAMVALAWTLANRLRYLLLPAAPAPEGTGVEWLVVLIAQGMVLWWTGLYRGLWRFASLPDLWNIARAAFTGVLAITLALFLLNRLEGVPRGVLALYPVLLLLLLGIPRLGYRFWKDNRYGRGRNVEVRRVLILGAGRAGEALLRELHREGRLRVVGLLDDDRALRGAKLHGVPVLGELSRVDVIAKEVAAEMLLIAIPTANNLQMQRVVELCEATRLPFRTVPRLRDIVDGRLSFNQLKEVAIEDLLGRDPVLLDWSAIRVALSGRRVLVTGGGGSIGSELCRQIARLGVASLAIVELSEFNLYRIEQELRSTFPGLDLHVILGDVGDPAVALHVLMQSRPDAVFHAAAFKHVPLLEGQLREAIRNNTLATWTLASACAARGVDSFLLVSTDKAVNPANVMGASKRWAEIGCQALSGNRTRFVIVRFGNVLDSAGSVVPLFREQIRRGGPVTVTHPDITRYFMTIPEACQLMLQALTLGRSGDVFALDMGEPVKIRYLAEQMIRLAGKTPDRDIGIVYTGLRAGEKLFEELFHPLEQYQKTSHPKIWQALPRTVQRSAVEAGLAEASKQMQAYDEVALERSLRNWVPEFGSTEDAADDGQLRRAV